jgi:uncharacterized membrane protein YczE
MKSFLQKYERQTHILFAVSVVLIALGVFLHVREIWGGVPVAGIVLAGLVWCFRRR